MSARVLQRNCDGMLKMLLAELSMNLGELGRRDHCVSLLCRQKSAPHHPSPTNFPTPDLFSLKLTDRHVLRGAGRAAETHRQVVRVSWFQVPLRPASARPCPRAPSCPSGRMDELFVANPEVKCHSATSTASPGMRGPPPNPKSPWGILRRTW
ncbi:hypothetical protein Z517_09302 [Fonsecaea pedrosoi CBS 271.37]|uniref:Uncharacterized protein n=1 Tax=Fonsecaea pedrosoi CBS 271.37 TaxID=1442368 RepID=A0A0D2G842_9EURO|nr:uncharacterized protein Z517_09302 [Fonsecaea pedrosoi CBS 271.37]KIW76858.1 hypothetical protein Z517_09302 [Fonsecaea pedrosoi CBS 271.37]